MRKTPCELILAVHAEEIATPNLISSMEITPGLLQSARGKGALLNIRPCSRGYGGEREGHPVSLSCLSSCSQTRTQRGFQILLYPTALRYHENQKEQV